MLMSIKMKNIKIEVNNELVRKTWKPSLEIE